jgi:hypothetical protein
VLPGPDELVSFQDQDLQVSLVHDPKSWHAAGFVPLFDAQSSGPQPVFEKREVFLLGRAP